MKTNPTSSLKEALNAVKKLSEEEKQLLWQMMYPANTLKDLRQLEAKLKKQKQVARKTDEEIVALTISIRRKNYAALKKMLH